MRLPFFLLAMIVALSGTAQKRRATVEPDPDSALFARLRYRLAGPFRGGRVAAVSGSKQQKNTFYFGATGGGVWKTTDGGSNWKCVSDKYFGGSIGAVAVAPSDDNIVYVGEGENTLRGNESEGLNGMWRSEDGGRTWSNIGLADARHVSRILVHPRDPNIAWAAVIGHSFGPNETRGVYKTTDGGKNWKRALFVNNQAGAAELAMEPGNPQVLYAGMWRVLRTPWSMESGGAGSGLWKSTDGGETWTNISSRKGLPKGTWGIVGVAVSGSNPDKIYALIENAAGGLFVSGDGGESWNLVSSDNNIRQRAWYYSKVFVDPKNENTVYAPNVNFMRSRDGGKTFQSLPVGHGDCHDIWIDPEDGNRMILGDDGGAEISFDGGQNWSTLRNQPTAQIYRVSTDNSFPYRILGAQQDNSTIRMRSRGRGRAGIMESDWEPTAGAESGYVVADPLNPDIVYGGNYGGYLSRLDHRTGENRAVSPWPDNPMGAGADVLKYRFQWNFPIFFSPHNPKRLYAAGNVLFATEDEGATWTQLSPDLTTNDKSKQAPSGGPITKDNTSVEYYCTIFTAMESPYEKDLLWTGSDDGVISVSRDGGKSWKNVTPAGAPKWIMWNCAEADPFKKGAAYFVGTRYKSDDFAPYIYKTEDYGQSWRLITGGIPSQHFTRALRADPRRAGLLYAGTEYGMYVSYNDGASWKPFQLNLPIVPITDMTIKNNDLIVATQGRSFWVLDDLSALQQWERATAAKRLQVFTPSPAYRLAGGGASFGTAPRNAGANPPAGVQVPFWVTGLTDSAKVRAVVFDKDHKEIRSFSSSAKEDAQKIEVVEGFNRFSWNALYPESERIEGMILWNGVPGGILAPPGNYFVRIVVDKDSAEVPVQVLPDPNYSATNADYAAQFAFLKTVQEKFNATQKAIRDIRSLRTRIDAFIALQGKDLPAEVKVQADSIQKRLTRIEETLYQTKSRSGQDVLNYPIRLNDKLSGIFDVANSGNFAPSRQVQDVYRELAAQIDAELARLQQLQDTDIKRLNELIREKALPVIGVR
ncbi:MAG: glycosyl hydrolase [Chitinophagaceae bacterium]|nr:MAG: glycosyl hydrolase [Chitinophagaceae bacterium]